ncbi:hypothetical protein H6P81_010729 [Aristolochia fimbriata]|uniref:Glycosyltransferase 61 catalytic domain-containing protein n=1 Tax=Aristolochia fimbriata TaxID=158543 RepID=A0AAV7EQ93_ARIFI|nr:hypothetical protein H6P81_010729 [Aristolochia fimbriata]
MLALEENPNIQSKQSSSTIEFCSRKLSVCFLLFFAVIFVLFQIGLWVFPFSSASSLSWAFFQQSGGKVFNDTTQGQSCGVRHDEYYSEKLLAKLRESVTFLPLKDLRFEKTAMDGHTWFISSLNDTIEAEGEPEFLRFPSEASKGRLLCVKGRSPNNGGMNSYALAWRDALPPGSTLLTGLTFVSDAYYDYGNLWHGITAALPFAWWRLRRGCVVPSRWVLYRSGELRLQMGKWMEKLMEAAFDGSVAVDSLDGADDRPVCFEEALVHRHTGGNMGLEERKAVFEMLRCRARAFCNVGVAKDGDSPPPPLRPESVTLTMLLRNGARAFKNESLVVGVFERACQAVKGCRFLVAHSDGLDFCDQVRILSSTDIVASPHGAQLTNMIFMDRGSSVMEFFPRGWLELAGVGQYVHHWLAKWSGMVHRGAWRDHHGDECPHGPGARGCFDFYKATKIGHNETYFAQWAMQVLNQAKLRKKDGAAIAGDPSTECPCT